jgi:hypothetical protein
MVCQKSRNVEVHESVLEGLLVLPEINHSLRNQACSSNRSA